MHEGSISADNSDGRRLTRTATLPKSCCIRTGVSNTLPESMEPWLRPSRRLCRVTLRRASLIQNVRLLLVGTLRLNKKANPTLKAARNILPVVLAADVFCGRPHHRSSRRKCGVLKNIDVRFEANRPALRRSAFGPSRDRRPASDAYCELLTRSGPWTLTSTQHFEADVHCNRV
jgi:hypothetical protein